MTTTTTHSPDAAASGAETAEAELRPGGEGARRVPPALVIVSCIVVLAAIATLVLPRGAYQRSEVFYASIDMTRSVVVPGSYAAIESEPGDGGFEAAMEALGSALLAPIAGFEDKADIIGFVILLGGAFGIMLGTGALDRGLASLVLALGKGPGRWLVVPVSMVLFSLGGAIFGMGESTIAFVLITVPLALRLGFDTITGICMCYLASQIGFGTAFFNPFSVGIAQAIAELPYMSGNWLRYIIWAVATTAGIAFVMWHAHRVYLDPRRSPTFAVDRRLRAEHGIDGAGSGLVGDGGVVARGVSARDLLVIACVLGSVLMTAIGVQAWGWWISEMAGCFVAFGIAAGLLAGMGPGAMVEKFTDGAKLMIEPALIIAVSAGIVYVLSEGRVLDTILYAVAQPLDRLGGSAAAVVMMVMQAGINFFVPSGSGQAAMTIPVTAPLCDIIELERQVGVLAYQFGDGFGNMVIPTSAVLMGVLGVARVDWTIWLRWVWPLILLLYAIGGLFLVIAVNLPKEWLLA